MAVTQLVGGWLIEAKCVNTAAIQMWRRKLPGGWRKYYQMRRLWLAAYASLRLWRKRGGSGLPYKIINQCTGNVIALCLGVLSGSTVALWLA